MKFGKSNMATAVVEQTPTLENGYLENVLLNQIKVNNEIEENNITIEDMKNERLEDKIDQELEHNKTKPKTIPTFPSDADDKTINDKIYVKEKCENSVLNKNINTNYAETQTGNSMDETTDQNMFCNETNEFKRTEIQEFYNGKNVFITGATGFLGKILVEKLLRSCPDVENLYLLVRQKKGKDAYTRVDEIFDDPVFDRLKEEVPKFRHKIVVIPGDCASTGLGMMLSDRQILVEKVNIVFHAAATVKFDEHLRAALATNVRAPLHLLSLARDMQHLDVLMHVSTAYSNCNLSRIEERFYPFPVGCEQLENLIEKLEDYEIDRLLPTILGSWPNTYAFTKALAENEIRNNADGLPLGIFRPAIVTSTVAEPIPSWVDNMYGPTGVVAGAATGVLRTLQCDASVSADVVPVDAVVSCLVASARAVHCVYRDSPSQEPPIYNYVSSVENRITWRDFMNLNCKHGFSHPLSSAMWYICITLNKSATMNLLCILLLHLLPAVLVDGLALCVGQKPRLMKMYRKIHKFSAVLCYFCTHEIEFCNQNVRQLWSKTSADDQKLFPFSMALIDWKDYFTGYIHGIRKHLFKETDESLQQARIKWNRLYYLHQLVRSMFYSFLIFALWTALSWVLSILF